MNRLMHDKSVLKGIVALGVLGICGLTAIVLYTLQSSTLHSDRCEVTPRQARDLRWQIAQIVDMDAQILWERPVPPHDVLMATSDDLVVYSQGPTECPQDGKIIGVDALDGIKQWSSTLSGLNDIIGIVYQNNSFFVMTCCTQIARIDSLGQELWVSSALPLRAFRPSLYLNQESIFVPTVSDVEQLRLASGSRQETLPIERSLGVFEDITLSNPIGRILEVRSWDSEEILWTALLPSDNSMSNFNTYLFDDILVVIYAGIQMTAYDKDTGMIMWELERESKSPAIVINEMILTYDDDRDIVFRDARSGIVLGSIELFYIGQSTPEITPLSPPIMAANNDTIFLWNNVGSDLIAISYKFD